MSTLADLFPGFAERRIATQDAEIYLRHGGEGPVLVLLHGYPQSHAMWHKVAGELAQHFTVVLPDLRGYGRCTDVSGEAIEAGHFIAEENPDATLAAMKGFLLASS